MYDLIIIGAGPAGVTAAVYAARKQMNFIVITDDIGGQATWSGDIENYTGYQFITGTELVNKFEEHMQKYNVSLKDGEKVISCKKALEGNFVTVTTEKGEVFEAKTVIIASGKRSRELGVPGELEFRKRGVTYCATCDGPLYAGKKVAVIGSGNSGLEAVLQLMNIATHIYLIDITHQLMGDPILQEKITKSDKVSIMMNTQVTEIRGNQFVESIKILSEKKEKKLSVEGVFVEVGLIPNSDFVGDVAKNQWGEVIVNNRNETNIPAVFAAGDVTDVPEKQIIIAAGEGSKACLSAFSYLAHQK
ncbi:MAG: FAD-dependent oxidoreductase [Candidatus Omnitrophica bacterium]|nr:FAD-dependent oxidoreductase [Candidatus Omnitrophota bacterium]